MGTEIAWGVGFARDAATQRGWRALSCSRAPPLGISCVELFQREAVKLGSLGACTSLGGRGRERERETSAPRGGWTGSFAATKGVAEDSELAPFSLISGACCRAMMNAERFNVTRICKAGDEFR